MPPPHFTKEQLLARALVRDYKWTWDKERRKKERLAAKRKANYAAYKAERAAIKALFPDRKRGRPKGSFNKPKPEAYKRIHGMVKDRRSGYWRVPFLPPGGKVKRYISTGEKDLFEALKVVDATGLQKLSMLARAKSIADEAISLMATGVKSTCEEIAQAWQKDLKLDQSKNTERAYSDIINNLFSRIGCGKQPAASITRQQLYDYVNDPATKETTRRARLTAIRSFYRHASGFGHVIGNISETVRINKSLMTVEQREITPAAPFTEEEYRRIMANPEVPQFWRWATAFGYWLGLRLSDVCSFERASMGDDFVVLYPKKTGRRLIMPLSDPLIGSGELKAVFDEIRMQTHNGKIHCFHEQSKTYPNLRGMTYSEVLLKCGIEGKSFHGWRHTFRLRLSNSWRPIEEVKNLMGHSSVATTMSYGRSAEKTA